MYIDRKVNILGTEYTVKRTLKANDPILETNDGYCDDTLKTIVVEDFVAQSESKGNLEEYAKKVTRHEIIHAFLSESGLQAACDWAVDETIVDYFAIQFPKMVRARRVTDCL